MSKLYCSITFLYLNQFEQLRYHYFQCITPEAMISQIFTKNGKAYNVVIKVKPCKIFGFCMHCKQELILKGDS